MKLIDWLADQSITDSFIHLFVYLFIIRSVQKCTHRMKYRKKKIKKIWKLHQTEMIVYSSGAWRGHIALALPWNILVNNQGLDYAKFFNVYRFYSQNV